MFKKISLFAFVILSIPFITEAHVRWFAHETTFVRPYSWSDLPVIASIAIVLIIVLIGVYLEKKLQTPKWFDVFTEKWAPNILSFASMGFGLSFLIFTYNEFVFAPPLHTHDVLLLGIQGIAGAMILFGIYERIAGLLILILFSLSVKEFGFMDVMDTFEMLGFAMYAMIIGRSKWKIVDTDAFLKLRHKLHPYGLPLLRVGTGLNLMILGFSEKILDPSLTANFLSKYHWNFMEMLGFHSYSNYWFAYSAGVSEALFGLFFLLGLVTRTTTLALAVFLITTLYLLGPIELIGHLPHFSIAIVLIILGSGSRLKI
ncbi:MAG: DoxX family membrane protein [Patescibacteria group bacterium]